jgi:D-alanine-D-alanine ligase
MTDRSLRVVLLAGGPDRERPVSLAGAAAVAAALRQAGHEVVERDIQPHDDSALDERCDVIFPLLHGPFGEGGPLQKMLEARGMCYVGSKSRAARTAIDKFLAKQVADAQPIRTPPYQQLGPTAQLELSPPLVLKPLTEGSSFNVFICHDEDQVADAREEIHRCHPIVLAERFIPGRELTVGILDDQVLPVIEIVSRAAFYDYEAKYSRDDTEYRFDIDLPAETLDQMGRDALTLHRAIGCRHLSRVDFLVDARGRPWFLEINTMPGMTDHSLVPKMAARAGIDMVALCDRLVQLALRDGTGR